MSQSTAASMSHSIMLRQIAKAAMLAGIGFVLASWGNRPGERALSGGLIGAGAGAGIGAITGGNPAAGALIGGGVGAIGGAVTSPRGER
jgi:osmotically inducible lipoprotein OsmB